MDFEVLKGIASNIITVVAFVVLYIIHEKCRTSKCASHAFCCTVEINDESRTEEAEKSMHEV